MANVSYSLVAGASAAQSEVFKQVYLICPNRLKTVENCSIVPFDKLLQLAIVPSDSRLC